MFGGDRAARVSVGGVRTGTHEAAGESEFSLYSDDATFPFDPASLAECYWAGVDGLRCRGLP